MVPKVGRGNDHISPESGLEQGGNTKLSSRVFSWGNIHCCQVGCGPGGDGGIFWGTELLGSSWS